MRYIIITQGNPPFLTPYFEPENHFAPGMIVIDRHNMTYTVDGVEWTSLEEDHL